MVKAKIISDAVCAVAQTQLLFKDFQRWLVFLVQVQGKSVYRKHRHIVRLMFQKSTCHFQHFIIFFGCEQNICLLADGSGMKRFHAEESVVIYKCRVCLARKHICITGHCKDIGDGISCRDSAAYIDAFFVSFFTVQKLSLGYLEIQVFRLHC